MSSSAPDRPAGPASPIDRLLRLFGDVQTGEGVTVLLMLSNIFLTLLCYSIIKVVREPLIILGGGAEVRSYSSAGQALLLMLFVPFYSWFASRVDRRRLLIGVTLFFVINIELFALAVAAHVPLVGVAFFIWVGIFNNALTAQFWSYANDIYSKPAGDRLFPIIAIGMTAGAPLGSLVAGRLSAHHVAPQMILQVSAALLLVSMGLYLAVNARETARTPAAADQGALKGASGFSLVFQSRYLRLIALLIVLLNVVNTTGEFLIASLVQRQAEATAALSAGDKEAWIGEFYGSYQFWVNVVALALQFFVASRLVKYAGLRGALLALPLIALGGYSIVALGVTFAVVRWVKTAENATDYSIMNTARGLLWLPTSREEKYKGKQAVDTFFVRAGDLLQAALVYAGTHWLLLSIRGFAFANVLLTIVWLLVAFAILRENRALARATAPSPEGSKPPEAGARTATQTA
jgi:ATP:ADP antiporter, AAA family